MAERVIENHVASFLKEDGLLTAKKFGYAAGKGAGGAVTQATNRATGVTINALAGQITTNGASLAAEASAVFVVTNNKVAATDVVNVCIASGAIALNTDLVVSAVANGSFSITVVNNNAAAGTAETGAIVINFVIIKGATT